MESKHRYENILSKDLVNNSSCYRIQTILVSRIVREISVDVKAKVIGSSSC